MKRAFAPPQQIAGGTQRQPDVLMTEREAAEHCRYCDRGLVDPVRSFQQWARRMGVPVKYVGRTRLYDLRVLDAFLDRASWTRRYKAGAGQSVAVR